MAKTLTNKAVEAVKPDVIRREIADGLLPGLYLVVQPSGSKSWAIRYRHGGKPRKLVLGPLAPKLDGPEPDPVVDAPLTLAGARQLARAKLQEVAAGFDPAAGKQHMKRAARSGDQAIRGDFEVVARRFIERYAKPKNRSWAETARLLGLIPDPSAAEDTEGNPIPIEKRPLAVKNGVCAAWRGRRVQDISRRDVVELLDGLVDRGAPIVANRTLSAVRKLFNWCVERSIIETNPAAGVRPPAPNRQRDRVLDDDELRAVWRASDSIGHPFGPLVKVLILTGQRREEVAGMRWSEVVLDGDAPLWTIPRVRMKKDKAHEVPLSPEVVAILDKLPKVVGNDFVFGTTGRTPPSGLSKAKVRLDAAVLAAARKAAAAAGEDPEKVKAMQPWVYHDFRRTMASGMARLGINLPVVEKVLAHESGSFAGIVGVYQRHGFTAEKRLALDAWGKHVLGLVGEIDISNVIRLEARS